MDEFTSFYKVFLWNTFVTFRFLIPFRETSLSAVRLCEISIDSCFIYCRILTSFVIKEILFVYAHLF